MPVRLIDTHVHLCDRTFERDREEVLERAARAGVEAIVAVGESLEEARANLRLQEAYPEMVRPAAGLFPTRLDREEAEEIEALLRAHRERWTAIGEVGLDYWKVQEPADRELQRELFTRFVDLALELDLPLNVHSRSAGRPTLELLLAGGARRVQMHAFDGRAAKALPGVEAGFYFSVPPSVVRSPQKQKLVRRLPLSCLLLETDSPVLAPDPRARNEPANLTVALAAICELKDLPREEVAETIHENTRRLYGERIVGPG